jgi:hypothetical protein
MVGQFVRPQPQAVAPGTPPASAAEHENLKTRWMGVLQNPAIQAGLFQAGTSMLANIGSNRPFVARLGTALGDGGGAAGRVQKYLTEKEQADRAAGQTDKRIGLEGQRVAQDAAQNASTAEYQRGSLDLQGRQLAATTANNQAELVLREKELGSNASYRNLALQQQREQQAATLAGMQTPRGRALLELQKAAMAQLEYDQTFDVSGYIDQAMPIIDKMFPPVGGAAPAPVGAPGPVAPGAPAPAPATSGASAAPPPEAIDMLKADTSPNAKANFDAIFGPGAAERVLKAAPQAAPSAAPTPPPLY